MFYNAINLTIINNFFFSTMKKFLLLFSVLRVIPSIFSFYYCEVGIYEHELEHTYTLHTLTKLY